MAWMQLPRTRFGKRIRSARRLPLFRTRNLTVFPVLSGVR